MEILICRLLFVSLLRSADLFLPEQVTSTGHSIEFPVMYFTNILMSQKQCWRKYFLSDLTRLGYIEDFKINHTFIFNPSSSPFSLIKGDECASLA